MAIKINADNSTGLEITSDTSTNIDLQSNDVTKMSIGSTIDIQGNELVLDADADTSIHADTDDVIDVKVGGNDNVQINALGSSRKLKVYKGGNDEIVLQSNAPDASGNMRKIELEGEQVIFSSGASGGTTTAQRMLVTSDGDILFNTTDDEPWNNSGTGNTGIAMKENGRLAVTSEDTSPLLVNRIVSDGRLVDFLQDGSTEGEITVSGSTVSYNGGHLSRWARLSDNSKPSSILKGTVMSNLDDMIVWEVDGSAKSNEQRNEVKVSDTEGDKDVAGLFVDWSLSQGYNDMNIAMTGDMVIRIAKGTTVQRGDLLMSAGDGTAKPQDDDIVRSKTIAKVTSTTVIKTYDDDSYLVPCVIMAC